MCFAKANIRNEDRIEKYSIDDGNVVQMQKKGTQIREIRKNIMNILGHWVELGSESSTASVSYYI